MLSVNPFITAVLLLLPAPGANRGQQQDAASTLMPEADPALVAARTALRGGHLAQAEQQARAILTAHPQGADGAYLLGEVLFREDKPGDSLKAFTEAAQRRPPSAYELRLVALDYVLLKDYDDADRWMSRSLAMDSSNADSWYTLGRIRQTTNRFADAITCFRKTLTLDPLSVKAEDNLGLAFEGLNKPDEAITAYRQAIAWQKDAPHPSAEPLLNLGILLGDRGQLPEARPLLEQAEALSPAEPRVHTALGKLLARTGDLPAAQGELEKALAATPDDAALHFQLGQVLRREGRKEAASAELEKAANLEKTHRE